MGTVDMTRRSARGNEVYRHELSGFRHSIGRADSICRPICIWPSYPRNPLSKSLNRSGGAPSCYQQYDVGNFSSYRGVRQKYAIQSGLYTVLVIKNGGDDGREFDLSSLRPALRSSESAEYWQYRRFM
jgi:hypothetical protein